MPGVLAKARKRGLAVCLAHQYIGQLDPKIAKAILANCGTLISFRVGVDDAPIIATALDAPESCGLPRNATSGRRSTPN